MTPYVVKFKGFPMGPWYVPLFASGGGLFHGTLFGMSRGPD